MDQKRAMLYPDIDPTAHSAATRDHRISASTAMGLPTEAPPSYDMAIASTSTAPNAPILESASVGDGGASAGGVAVLAGWNPSAPAATASTSVMTEKPSAPIPPQRQQRTVPQQPAMPQHENQTRPVIVVQPLPHNQQQQQPQAPTIHTANASVPIKLGPHPCAITCPVCGANKTTRMVFTPNTRTHVCAGLLCLAGWCCCACTVPYCMNSCRTGNHYCSQCNTFLGVYNPRRARK